MKRHRFIFPVDGGWFVSFLKQPDAGIILAVRISFSLIIFAASAAALAFGPNLGPVPVWAFAAWVMKPVIAYWFPPPAGSPPTLMAVLGTLLAQRLGSLDR